MLSITEIFCSVQGEGSDAGLVTVFVRLYGCNINCSYCDTTPEPSKAKNMLITDILDKVRSYKLKVRSVCVTGGEPLLQTDTYPLVYELLRCGYRVNIETSGCIYIAEDQYARSYRYTMDIKCPSSNVSHKNVYSNLSRLKTIDEVKFVVFDVEDYNFAKRVLARYETKAKILFSPVFVGNNPVISKELCNWIIKDKLDCRVSVQLQKI